MKNLQAFLRIALTICLFLSAWSIANAQSKEHIDSLMEVVKKAPDDTNKLQNISDIIDASPDGVWQKYNEQLKTLATKLLVNNKPAVKLFARKFLAVYYMNLASDLGEKGHYKEALGYYRDCLKVQEEIGDKALMAATICNMGAIYDRDGDPEKAIANYNQAIKLEETISDDKTLSAALALSNFKNLISALTNAGKIYFVKNNYDSALLYFEKGLQVAEQQKINNPDVSILYKDLGYVMERTGDLNKALEYFNKGLKVSEDGGDKIGKSVNLLGIAEVNFDKGEIINSLGNAQQSMTLAIKTHNPENIILASNLLTRIYKKQSNFKEALGTYELEVKTRDSLMRADNHKAVVQNQFQVEFDKKQDSTKAEQAKVDAVNAKELENQKRIRNFTLGGMMVVVFFLILVFRQRNKIAKEKHRSEELLLNILPEDVAEELKNTGGAKVKSFELVTVLFTDFKGFTQISEKLTPEELVAEIDHCFCGFDNIIHKYGIEKIKTIGDSYMCAGGVPKANSTHAEDVVNAALEIRDFIINHKKEREARGEIPFEVRIGVNTGPVVAGIVGVKKFAYDIWGDAVNLASRMESSGEPGKVNISGNTYALVKDKFHCQYRGKVMAKGKGDVDMYFIEKL